VPYEQDGKRYILLYNCTGLRCVEIKTGNELWYHKAFFLSIADPIFFGNRIFISSGDYAKMCQLIEISDGKPKLLWEKNSLRDHFSTSAYVDGYLYGCDGNFESADSGNIPFPFRCVDSETGDIVWEEIMKHASVLVADGKLILLQDDGTLRIAEATPASYKEISHSGIYKDGKQPRRQIFTPPVLYEGKIYCRDAIGSLICVDASI
jgi:outer membrane protein assembly factor BamB